MEFGGSPSSSSASSSKALMENLDQPHVLAVDDNLVDRKLIEKLLKNSSCKGNIKKNNSSFFSPYLFLVRDYHVVVLTSIVQICNISYFSYFFL